MEIRILQRLIAQHASAITTTHEYINEYQSAGRAWKERGERGTAGYYYNLADQQRKELKRMVESQRALKRELDDTIKAERQYRGFEDFIVVLQGL